MSVSEFRGITVRAYSWHKRRHRDIKEILKHALMNEPDDRAAAVGYAVINMHMVVDNSDCTSKLICLYTALSCWFVDGKAF